MKNNIIVAEYAHNKPIISTHSPSFMEDAMDGIMVMPPNTMAINKKPKSIYPLEIHSGVCFGILFRINFRDRFFMFMDMVPLLLA